MTELFFARGKVSLSPVRLLLDSLSFTSLSLSELVFSSSVFSSSISPCASPGSFSVFN